MPVAQPFRVGLVQTSCSLDSQENLDKAIAKIREAAERGAQIICLEELFRSQYFCREENAELYSSAGRVDSRTFHRGDWKSREGIRRWYWSRRCLKGRARGAVPQHRPR